MSLLWDRSVELIIGKSGEEGRSFKGLDVEFSIEKNSEASPNTAEIKIYNLSPASRAILENEKELICILNVGYGQHLEQVAIGNISKSSSGRSGNSIVSTIVIGDGEKAYKESKIDKSYAPGTGITQVLDDVIGSFGLAVNTKKDVDNDVFHNGLSISGSSKDVMDNLTSKLGLEWSIQDNEIQVLKPTSDTGEEAVVLTPNTGLVGSPVKREEGIEFQSLLQPQIRPGKLIKIESLNFNGIFRVRKLTHSGNTQSSEWYTKGVAIPV